MFEPLISLADLIALYQYVFELLAVLGRDTKPLKTLPSYCGTAPLTVANFQYTYKLFTKPEQPRDRH
jgi:hypothetical protein